MASMRDKTIGHMHTDPILIEQIGARSTLQVGQVVFVDSDGIYKPAMAVEDKQRDIEGVVWSFVGNDAFLLRVSPGPMQFRLPLTRDFFNQDGNGRIIENSPNDAKIPGTLGQKLYLSATVPGGLQATRPTSHALIVGYKTDYGFMYRPDLVECCDPVVDCPIYQYQVCVYTYACSATSWQNETSYEIKLHEPVAAEILDIPLLGAVSISGSNLLYVGCDDEGNALCQSIPENGTSPTLYSFNYETDHNVLKRTIVSRLKIYGSASELYKCTAGIITENCDTVLNCPDPSTLPDCTGCCD